MRTVRRTCLVVVLALLAVSCASKTEPAVLESLPLVTVQSDWTSYIDETSSFGISYPNDWDLLEIDKEAVDELLAPLMDGSEALDAQLAATVTVFGAGSLDPAGIADPNVNIGVEPLPIQMTSDEYASFANQGAKDVFPSWETTSQAKVGLADHDAAINRSSFLMSDLGPDVTDETRWWMVQLYVTDENVGWAVACGTSAVTAADAADNLETCEQVVRSFELLTP